VNELFLHNCSALQQHRDGPSYRDIVQQLADIVRDKHNLSTLRVLGCDFFEIPQFSDAVVEVLFRRDSPWRRFDFSIEVERISVPVVRSLLTAVSNNTQLERLHIDWRDTDLDIIHADHSQALVNALPSFKIPELTLFLFHGFQDEGILEALKRNYTAQSVHCKTYDGEDDWFNAADQARLDFFVNRNRQLAQWIKNPKLVPRELWSYAIMLALEAGINSLFQSLVALSGQGIGLPQQSRKRKPVYYDPADPRNISDTS